MKPLTFITHFAAFMIITVLCGLTYVTVQQTHRTSANDPQLQMALDLKNAIETNRPTVKWMTVDSIEISKSLSVFKTFYKPNGEPLQSTGFLDGQTAQDPKESSRFYIQMRRGRCDLATAAWCKNGNGD
jgi:hypothetical protein